MSDERAFRPVLVYIQDQRGLYLASEVLRSGGFDVKSVGNITELELALEFLTCCVVVTVTSKIGEVRSLANIPVVNIQAFVLPNHDASAGEQSALFDRQAFLERVRDNNKYPSGASRYGAPFVN